MARKSDEPLEKRDVILFKGDWEELVSYLAPLKVRPTVFIRMLVRKKILEIRERANAQARPTPELSDDDIEQFGLTESPESSEPEES